MPTKGLAQTLACTCMRHKTVCCTCRRVKQARVSRGEPAERAARAQIREAVVQAALAAAPQGFGLAMGANEAPSTDVAAASAGAVHAAGGADATVDAPPEMWLEGYPDVQDKRSHGAANGSGGGQRSDDDMDAEPPLAVKPAARRASAEQRALHAQQPRPSSTGSGGAEAHCNSGTGSAAPRPADGMAAAQEQACADTTQAACVGVPAGPAPDAEPGLPSDGLQVRAVDCPGGVQSSEEPSAEQKEGIQSRSGLSDEPAWLDEADASDSKAMSQQPVYASG